MINKVIDWLAGISFMIAAVAGFVAGFRYVGSVANPKERAAAKKMLINVFIGIFFIFAAWYMVDLILTILSKSGGAGMGPDSFSGLEK